MMHTEDEAKTKACHQSFERNRTTNDPTWTRCIASDCMAWEGAWRKIVKDRMRHDEQEIKDCPVPPIKNWERVGDCGLKRNAS